MSIATEQKLTSKQNKNRKSTSRSNSLAEAQPPSSHEPQHMYGGKSINSPSNGNNQTSPKDRRHVTKKSKTLTKQTPVVETSTDTDTAEEAEGAGSSEDHGEDGRTPPDTVKHQPLRQLEDIEYTEIYDTPPDYRIYQEGKVNEFFGESLSEKGIAPKTVSEVCLVNDHFILVKMPSKEEATKEPDTDRVQSMPASGRDHGNNRKLCHFLRRRPPQRIRKIAPINEDVDCVECQEADNGHGSRVKNSKSLHCLNVNSCWGSNSDEVEIYESRTKIQHSAPQAIVRVESSARKSTKSSQTPERRENNNTSVDNHNSSKQEVHTISGALLTSSQHERVMLRQCGALVTSKDHNEVVDLNHCRKTSSTSRRRGRFFWLLLRPFRRKARKPKPKIQAVVYKSYFVKWTKPPESLYHGFGGIKSTKLADFGTSVLRRCRSAIF